MSLLQDTQVTFLCAENPGKDGWGEAKAGLQDEGGQSFNTSRHEELGMVEQYRKRLFLGQHAQP